MKNIVRITTIMTAVTFGAAALATAGGGSDPIAQSFERDLNRQPTPQVFAQNQRNDKDPMQDFVNAMLRDKSISIHAQFARDLNRSPTHGAIHVAAPVTDPLQQINTVLRGHSAALRAAFARDLNRSPAIGAPQPAVANHGDPLTALVNAPMWNMPRPALDQAYAQTGTGAATVRQ